MYRFLLAPLSLVLSALFVVWLVESTWVNSHPLINFKHNIESALGITRKPIRKENTLPFQVPDRNKASQQYTVTIQPAMLFVGIEKRIDLKGNWGNSALSNAWKEYTQNSKTLGIENKISNRVYIIYTDSSQYPIGHITIFLAYRVSEFAGIPLDFDTLTVPKHTYATFNIRSDSSSQVATFWDKLDSLNLDRTYRYDMESYDSSSLISYKNPAQVMISIH